MAALSNIRVSMNAPVAISHRLNMTLVCQPKKSIMCYIQKKSRPEQARHIELEYCSLTVKLPDPDCEWSIT